MQNKVSIYLLFLFLLIIPFSHAISVSPTIIQATTFNNQETPFQLSITNDYNYAISEIYVENINYTRFQTLSSPIQPNETRNIFLLINSPKSQTITMSGKISFIFLNNITRPSQTFYYNFSNNSYPEIHIKNGDSVLFTNIDSVQRSLLSSDFSYNLQPSQSQLITFNTIKNLSYYDQVSVSTNTIYIQDRNQAERIYNPASSINLQINLQSSEMGTPLEISLFEPNISLNSYTDTKDSVIRIKNIGQNFTAEHINLSANQWITFINGNDFNLAPNQEKVITFTVSPLLTQTSQTNQTYNIIFSAKGSNSQSINPATLSLFIPYGNVFNLSREEAMTLGDKIRLTCILFPDLCSEKNATTPQVIRDWKVLSFNVSEGWFNSVNNNLGLISTSNDNLIKNLNAFKTDLQIQYTSINQSMSRIESKQDILTSKMDNVVFAIWFLFWAIIIIFALVIGFFVYKHFKNKEEE